MEITETHLNAIQEVAAAMRMTVNEFLGSSSFDVEFMKPLRPESGPQSGRPW